MTIQRPQRITPPAPVGSMLKRPSALPQRSRSSTAREDHDHLALVRQLPCLYCGVEPCGEAAHVKFNCAAFGKANKLGRRPHDCDSVPLCRDDHQNARHAQHKGSEEAFWNALGISPYLVAKQLYAQRGDLVAMRAVIFLAIAERSRKA